MAVCCRLLFSAEYFNYLVRQGPLPQPPPKLARDGACLHANTSTCDVPGSSGKFIQRDCCGSPSKLARSLLAAGVSEAPRPQVNRRVIPPP